jgi:hypothetical protein
MTVAYQLYLPERRTRNRRRRRAAGVPEAVAFQASDPEPPAADVIVLMSRS